MLNLDHDEARALHRIVRAMHDGECPKCHDVFPSEAMRTPAARANGVIGLGWVCPVCKFEITADEADEVFRIFAPFMERNLDVFEKWRADRAKKPPRPLPAEGAFSCWNYIAAMIEQNVHHKTKHYGLGKMSWTDQLNHLRDEVMELRDVKTSTEAVGEIADVLGIVLHMAICQGETPKTLADRLLAKLRERFESPRLPEVRGQEIV